MWHLGTQISLAKVHEIHFLAFISFLLLLLQLKDFVFVNSNVFSYNVKRRYKKQGIILGFNRRYNNVWSTWRRSLQVNAEDRCTHKLGKITFEHTTSFRNIEVFLRKVTGATTVCRNKSIPSKISGFVSITELRIYTAEKAFAFT